MNLIKIHGGKGRLHKYIIQEFPKNYVNMYYCECFAGGASVLLNKKPSLKEILNDIDFDTYNLLMQVKRVGDLLAKDLSILTYSKETFLKTLNSVPISNYQKAVKEYVIRRMSRGGLGKDFAWSDRLRGGIPGDVNAWNNALNNLDKIRERLQSVQVMNLNGLSVIKGCNGPNWLIYEDPPYLPSTRTSKNDYRHEMTEADHVQLAQINNESKAKILISGYNSDLYDKLYKGWNKVEIQTSNNAGQNKKKQKRTEVIWKNY